jgi:peptide/nickel transport system substrate-binding protein
MRKEILRTGLVAGAMLLAVAGAASAQTISEVARERTLILENIDGRVPVPDNMNPFVAGQYLDWGMWQAVSESLFYLNLETGKLEPWLAESGEYSDDAKTVTIKLRKGAKWADGVDFTADDVKFTIEMLKANPKLMYSGEMNLWVDSVTAADPQTVQIALKSPNPRFLVDYFGVRIWETVLIVPKHIWEGQDPNTFTNFDLARGLPLGTGPYKLVRSTETETVFDRLPKWWGAETGFQDMPVPERVIWIAAPTEDVRAAKAVNNELDGTWIMSRSTFEIARQRNPNIIGWTKELPYAYLDACPRDLRFNTELAPVNNKVIRHAINDAIDRQQLIDVAFEGMTEPSYSVFPTYAPLAQFLARNEASLQLVHSNRDQVSPALEAEGYKKNADGLWADAQGNTIKIEMAIRSGETDQLKMGPVLIAQLRKAGFDASSRSVESAVYFTDVATGKAPVWVGGECGSVQDPYASFSHFHSNVSAPIGESAPQNHVRFKNARFDELVDKMAGLTSGPEFDAAADEALKIMSEELPVAPLVQARLLTPFNTTYWTNFPTAENPYIHPGHWWVTGNYIIHGVTPTQK